MEKNLDVELNLKPCSVKVDQDLFEQLWQNLITCVLYTLIKMTNQLNEKLEKCIDQNYALDLGNKLKEFPALKELKPQVLNSLVSKITCISEANIRIHCNFVNPFQES